MWDSVAPGWEANAAFVDAQLASATACLMPPGLGRAWRCLIWRGAPGEPVWLPLTVLGPAEA